MRAPEEFQSYRKFDWWRIRAPSKRLNPPTERDNSRKSATAHALRRQTKSPRRNEIPVSLRSLRQKRQANRAVLKRLSSAYSGARKRPPGGALRDLIRDGKAVPCPFLALGGLVLPAKHEFCYSDTSWRFPGKKAGRIARRSGAELPCRSVWFSPGSLSPAPLKLRLPSASLLLKALPRDCHTEAIPLPPGSGLPPTGRR